MRLLSDHPVYVSWPVSSGSIEVDAPGSAQGKMHLDVGVSACGNVWDGVGVRMEGECGFIISFDDLERWYLANKELRDGAERKQASREEIPDERQADDWAKHSE